MSVHHFPMATPFFSEKQQHLHICALRNHIIVKHRKVHSFYSNRSGLPANNVKLIMANEEPEKLFENTAKETTQTRYSKLAQIV